MSSNIQGTQLSILDLTKAFSKKTVLNSLNLEVKAGEFVAIVGRSGCGKSTLLRLVSGLDKATSGGILLDGEPLHRLSRFVTVMFQDPRLLPWKHVVQNVGLGLEGNWREKALWALDKVGLKDRADEWPYGEQREKVRSGFSSQLNLYILNKTWFFSCDRIPQQAIYVPGFSTSQNRVAPGHMSYLVDNGNERVSLARALVSQPRLLLLDEPLGALDALTRQEMQSLIQNLCQERRFTAFLVTHDVEEAVALADRVIMIEEGQISLDLPVRLSRPRDRSSEMFVNIREAILKRVMSHEGTQSNNQLLQFSS